MDPLDYSDFPSRDANRNTNNVSDENRPSDTATRRDSSKLTLNPLSSDNWSENIPSSGHVQFFRAVDWSKTPLGDLKGWPLALRLQCFSLFADSRPSSIYWGPSRVAIYNEQFIPLAARARTSLMGATFQKAFAEEWQGLNVILDKAEKSSAAAVLTGQLQCVRRNGFLEETYFDGSFIPLRGDEGSIEGYYYSVNEVTKQKLSERRKAMLNDMSIWPNLPSKSFADCIIPFLESNPRDIPMALLYEMDKESSPGQCIAILRGSIGVPEGHEILIRRSDIRSSRGLMPLFREAHTKAITLPLEESPSPTLFEGINWRGFGDPSKFFSIIPVMETVRLFGFLVIGANPRRPIDEDHYQFLQDIHTKVGLIAASVVNEEEARNRSERLERELANSQRQIRFFAENASFGMQNLSVDGFTVWANDQFYRIAGLTRQTEVTEHKLSFIDMVLEEDRQKARECWARLLDGEVDVTTELRLKRMFTPPSGPPEPAQILSVSFPYIEDGKPISIMTCTTDISKLKWAEAVEARNAKKALETKRQTVEFIDTISHEMRNPLSAILQCAESIQRGTQNCQQLGYSMAAVQRTLDENEDAANTILMCVKHQQTIVDDVLKLSKLDHSLLSISPEAISLSDIVERVLKMFAPDLNRHNINIDSAHVPSLKDNGIDLVKCDPSRINQILMNLLTNAIKFTKEEAKRGITVRYGATVSDARKVFPENIVWAINQAEMRDLTEDPQWGTGKHVYLCIQVSDTGVGMSQKEIKKLFARFEQAGLKTMIEHGGSGLGLFISKRLTEMQGGEIGVASAPNKGSTFAFYVKCRQVDQATIDAEMSKLALASRSRSNSTATSGIPKSVSVSDVKSAGAIHVLVVEDNIVNQQLLVKGLALAGCIVHTANDGEKALAFLHSTDLWFEPQEEPKHLDIILMDCEMPVMDGLTCSETIRELQQVGHVTRHIQIIAITANVRKEQIDKAIDSGIDCVVSKPFRVTDLMEKMRERLRIGRPGRG